MITDPNKPKAVFDSATDARMRNEAAQELVKLLRVRGMEKAEAERIVTQHLDRITTVAKVGGHELKVRLLGGTTANAYELRLFVAELERESHLDSFGPRPETVLAERLYIGGYEAEEAARLAKRYASRMPDGRIRAAYPDGREEFSSMEEGSPMHGEKVLGDLADSLVRERERRPSAPSTAAPDPLAGHIEYRI